MTNVKDILVVGYGPAGITAAIYAARKQLEVVLVGDLPGGEVRNSGDIENWPGDQATDGNSLADKFIAHLKDHAKEVKVVQSLVESIEKQGEVFVSKLSNREEYRSRTVIYAAGRHPRELNVPGEKELKNRGVTYCATCDAPLFAGKSVAVIGGGNTGAEAVIMLQRIAEKIYLLHNQKELAADAVLVKNFIDDPKVEILLEANTRAIEGGQMVEALRYVDAGSDQEHSLPVQGVFVTIGAIPNTAPVKDLVALDEFGAVVADRYGRTNVPGFFAAGDVTDNRDAQIVVAAGHGCSAALSAGDFLSRATGL